MPGVNPSQRQLLQDLVAQMTLAVGELQAQTIDIAAQTASISAQAANIALTAADQTKAKNYARWQSEYLAGANVDLDAIEAGTHVFPSV